MPTLYLIDASLYVFRAWHSLPEDMTDAEGWPVNAVHGFARFLLELLERERPQYLALAFDEALETSFRNRLYPAYKANRPPAPESLKRQFALCQRLSAALGLCVLADPHYEADDLIASLLTRQRSQGFQGLIVSADKDLSQLLKAGDQQWDYARQQRWGAEGVKARYGVEAGQITDFLGLAGDAIDNIPGVSGIGTKTAIALLEHFGSLEALLARLDELPFLRLRGAAAHAARLREQADQARLSKQLATLACDAPLPADVGHAERRKICTDSLQALLDHIRAGPMTRRRALAQLD